MALLHEQLYRNRDFTKINIRQYIHDLVKKYSEYYENRKNSIEFKLDIEEMNMALDVCLPLGLIINETIIEAFNSCSIETNTRKFGIMLCKHNDKNLL